MCIQLLHITFSCYVLWYWLHVYVQVKVVRRGVALTVLCIWQEAGCSSLLGLCTYVVGLFVGRFHMKFGQFSLTRINDLQGCVGNVTYVIDPTVWFVLDARLECIAHLVYAISWTQCCAQNTVDSFFITQLNSDTAAYVKYVLRLRV